MSKGKQIHKKKGKEKQNNWPAFWTNFWQCFRLCLYFKSTQIPIAQGNCFQSQAECENKMRSSQRQREILWFHLAIKMHSTKDPTNRLQQFLFQQFISFIQSSTQFLWLFCLAVDGNNGPAANLDVYDWFGFVSLRSYVLCLGTVFAFFVCVCVCWVWWMNRSHLNGSLYNIRSETKKTLEKRINNREQKEKKRKHKQN